MLNDICCYFFEKFFKEIATYVNLYVSYQNLVNEKKNNIKILQTKKQIKLF